MPLVVNGDPDENEVVIQEKSRPLSLPGAHTHATQKPLALKHEPSASNADPPLECRYEQEAEAYCSYRGLEELR